LSSKNGQKWASFGAAQKIPAPARSIQIYSIPDVAKKKNKYINEKINLGKTIE